MQHDVKRNHIQPKGPEIKCNENKQKIENVSQLK